MTKRAPCNGARFVIVGETADWVGWLACLAAAVAGPSPRPSGSPVSPQAGTSRAGALSCFLQPAILTQ